MSNHEWRNYFTEDDDKKSEGFIVFFGDHTKVDLIPEDRLLYTCVLVDDETADTYIWSKSKKKWSKL